MSKVREIFDDFQEIPAGQAVDVPASDKMLHQFLYNWHRIALTKTESWGFYFLTQEMLKEFNAAGRGDYKGVFKSLLANSEAKNQLDLKISFSNSAIDVGRQAICDASLTEAMIEITDKMKRELRKLQRKTFEENRGFLEKFLRKSRTSPLNSTVPGSVRYNVSQGEGDGPRKSMRLSQQNI